MDTTPSIDLRELVPAVAVWLVQLGFQAVECGPAPGDTATITARWEGAGQSFSLLLQATPADARCHLWSRERGLCFTWMKVRSLAQVQELLTQNVAFHTALLTATSSSPPLSSSAT